MLKRVRKSLNRGMTVMYGVEESELGGLSMGLIDLQAGDRFGETLNCREAILVLLSGTCRIRGEGFDHGEQQGRSDLFDGPPIAIYCPPGMYGIKALTDCQLAVFRYDLDKNNKGADPMVISPEMLGSLRGDVPSRTLCDLSGSMSGLCVGEAHYTSSDMTSAPSLDFTAVTQGIKNGIVLLCADSQSVIASVSDNCGTTQDAKTNDVFLVSKGDELSIGAQAEPLYCLWATANA